MKPKKFEELKTIYAQKMRIVKDAISQINIKMFTPKMGYYLNFTKNSPYYNANLKEIFQQKETKCDCCAKGAIFSACVLNVNEVTESDAYSEEYFQKDKLSKWFSALELDMIETAFEKKCYNDTDDKLCDRTSGKRVYSLLGKKCLEFGGKYNRPKKRLLAILGNILKNATFKP